jgi:RNA polymerase sigma factor (sigma-70 family)
VCGDYLLDDVDLVERAVRGDMSAYEELVRRYQAIAFRTAFIMTRNPEASEDAAQSGFIKAYYALPRFRRGSPFRPWLLKIVANEARNQIRSAHRRSVHEFQLTEDPTRDTAAQSPETTVIAALGRDELLDALNQLPDAASQIIAYRYFLDLSEAEMASVIGCPRGTVKSRLSRALGLLRDTLAAHATPTEEELHHA